MPTAGRLLLSVDLLFVAAYLVKLVPGAGVPLLIGITASTVMTTWQRDRQVVIAERQRQEGSLGEFVERLRLEPGVLLPVENRDSLRVRPDHGFVP